MQGENRAARGGMAGKRERREERGKTHEREKRVEPRKNREMVFPHRDGAEILERRRPLIKSDRGRKLEEIRWEKEMGRNSWAEQEAKTCSGTRKRKSRSEYQNRPTR